MSIIDLIFSDIRSSLLYLVNAGGIVKTQPGDLDQSETEKYFECIIMFILFDCCFNMIPILHIDL